MNNTPASLEGQSVVVIGGSSGIGLGCAIEASEAGAKVTIVSRSKSKLHDALPLLSERATCFELDIQNEEAVQEFFNQSNPIDHLVISASTGAIGPITQMDSIKAHQFFETKFWGVFYCAKHGAAKIADSGSITLVSGIASRRPFPGLTCAGACNGALESLGRGLAVELTPIRVNTIAPGLVDTPLYSKMQPQQRQAFLDAAAQKLPTRKTGLPTDIGQAALMLMTNSFITGTVLDIDGGHMVST